MNTIEWSVLVGDAAITVVTFQLAMHYVRVAVAAEWMVKVESWRWHPHVVGRRFWVGSTRPMKSTLWLIRVPGTCRCKSSSGVSVLCRNLNVSSTQAVSLAQHARRNDNVHWTSYTRMMITGTCCFSCPHLIDTIWGLVVDPTRMNE